MYGICGRRSDGKILNCPYNVPSVKVLGNTLLLSFYIYMQDYNYICAAKLSF